MTETLIPPVAAPRETPLAVLFGIVATTARLTRDEEREGAVTAADEHIYRAYTDTLGMALEEHEWAGYPGLRDNGLEPSAVAYLGGGLWLHHTITADADYHDVLTLIAPCACGRGYLDSTLEGERDLLELLEELRHTAGLAEHTSDRGGRHCAGITGSAGAAARQT